MSMSLSTDSNSTTPFGLAVLVVLAGGLAGLASCSWSQRPDPESAVVSSIPVGDSLEPEARVFPIDNGLWARVERRGRRDEEADEPTGELLRMQLSTGGDESANHVFVRVASHDWGSYLQRLDTSAVRRPRGSVRIEPIPTDASGTPTASGACRGRGAIDADDGCFRHASPGRRWFVYAAKPSGRMKPTSNSDLSLPHAPTALVERTDDALRVLAGGDGLPEHWWTVPSSSRGEGLAGSRTVVAVDDGCPEGSTGLGDGDSVATLRRNVPDDDHPLAVANRAYAEGVDALVRCEDESLEISIPSLFRPWLHTPDRMLLGPSPLGHSSVRLSRSIPAERRALAVRALSRVAVGAPQLAYFDLQRLFRHVESDEAGRLPVRAMSVAVAAGFPESALRWARNATRGAWNPESDPDYRLGRAAVRAGLGGRSGSVIDVEAARKAAGRRGEARLRRWLEWTDFATQRATTGRSSVNADERADDLRREGLARWAKLYRWVAARENPSFRADTNSGGKDAEPIARGLARRDVALPCPDATCPLDVYGRRLSARFDRARQREEWTQLVDDLRRLGGATFRPGFDRSPRLDAIPESRRLDFALALARHFDQWPSAAARRWFESAAAWVLRTPSQCGPVDRAASLTPPTGSGDAGAHLELMAWLVGHLESSACGTPGRAADSLADWVDRTDDGVRLAAPLFKALFEQTDSGVERTRIAGAAAESLRADGAGTACHRWHLALAHAHVAADDHEGAQQWLESGVNCPDADVAALDRTGEVLGAFVAFQRAGRLPRRLGPDLGPSLQRLVRERVRTETCAGLARFEYELTPDIADSVLELSRRLDIAGPEDADASLSLASASDQLDTALERLQKARTALADGNFQQGATHLVSASGSFGRIDHLPGRTLTAFLEDTFFESSPADYEEVPEGDLDCQPSEADAQTVRESLANPSGRRCLLRRGDLDGVLEATGPPDASWTSDARRGWVALSLLKGTFDAARRRTARHVDRAPDPSSPFADLCGAGPEWQDRFGAATGGNVPSSQLFTSARSTP